MSRAHADHEDHVMEFVVAFADDEGPVDVEITLAGPLSADAFYALNDRLVGDPRFRAGLRLLVDLTALDGSSISDVLLERVTEPVAERDSWYPPAAVAIVAPDERTFEAARLYRAHLGGMRSNRHIFTSRDDALAWLREHA